MVIKLLAASSKPAKERLARWAGATLLCQYVHVITLSPWPLLRSIGYKQVTGPAYTQGGGNDGKVLSIRRQESCVPTLIIDLG